MTQSTTYGTTPATNGKASPLFDATEIRRSLATLNAPNQVTELRVLDAVTATHRWAHTAAGYFDNVEELVAALASIRSAKGIYFCPNPVDPALLARVTNRIKKAGNGELTCDNDILTRHWLLIDADPQRPAGISANDSEHEAALARANAIRDELHFNSGWPAPVEADSGNGGHLMYRIEPPRDDGGLVARCLAALAARFDDELVTIDTTVHNAARIWKLYGTLACKGDSTPDRPHRMSRILSAPVGIQVVSRALLESLAAEVPSSTSSKTHHMTNGLSFDIDMFISQHGLEVEAPAPWRSGRRWVFKKSPLCDHHDGAAFIAQLASGALVAKCHHNSCSWGWSDLRKEFEPQTTLKAMAGTTETKAAKKDSQLSAELICLADVEPEMVEWLWSGRIPIGKTSC